MSERDNITGFEDRREEDHKPKNMVATRKLEKANKWIPPRAV